MNARFWLCLIVLCLPPVVAQDDDLCLIREKEYNTSSFEETDFLTVDQGIVVGDEIELDRKELDLENLVLGLEQPFYVDYLSEGAGANHLFGFLFFDIDTDKDGFPDFFETKPTDDLDGDGLLNQDDTDDDADGILDTSDTRPSGVTNSMPGSAFRNGTVAEAASVNAGDYWQFVPNSRITEGSYTGYFEHPGAYLYMDNNNNDIPDPLEYSNGRNKVPPYLVDKGTSTEWYTQAAALGLQGNAWTYAGTPGTTTADKYHWTGSTIYYICDDDGDTGQGGPYVTYFPYRNGSNPLYTDVSNTTNAAVDYLIYGSSDPNSTRIPSMLVNTAANGTKSFVRDARNQEMYTYRWYQSNISGARELVFYLTVFYGAGGANVQTYYSKSAFNIDLPGNPGRNGATTGDQYGRVDAALTGTNASNWFPQYSVADHNELAQRVWGVNWSGIASLTLGQAPVLNTGAALLAPGATQEWVDAWENSNSLRRVIQYRALADWFRETTVNANNVINGRYGIDMSAEGDSSIIRASNGKMVHLMVGAPDATKDAWLLGWEDLFNGGDRDFEDVVFYVKRQAGGELVSLNVADDIAQDLSEDAEYSLSQVSFTFEDNFTDNRWGTENTYIAYFYRLAQNDEWIPLLGGDPPANQHHLRTIDKFQPEYGGSTTESNGVVTRTVTITVEDKKTELFWKVQMASDNLDNAFQPKVLDAKVGYQSLVHDFYYNGAVIPNSNINYITSHETPLYSWNEKRNRGHLYALQTFIHGSPLTLTEIGSGDSPENSPSEQPTAMFTKPGGGQINLFKWDAGVSMLQDLESGTGRTIYTYIPNNTVEHSDNLSTTRLVLDPGAATLPESLVEAFDFSNTKTKANVWLDNYHNPSQEERDPDAAAIWLINWIHGQENPVVGEDGVVSSPELREWVLGGINRASPLVIRAPGRPTWLDRSSGIDVSVKRSYLTFAKEQAELQTRVIVGTESGLIHCIDAGTWIGEADKDDATNQEYDWAEGHYKDDNYGTGKEVWAMLPGHFLPDIKFNYTHADDVVAKIDSTAVSTVVYQGGDWKRIAVFTQGYKGGSQTVEGETRTGNVVFAMDLTDVDDPKPLWQRADTDTQDIVNPITIGWMKLSASDKRWIVCYPSGGSAVSGSLPTFHIVDAYTGESLREVSVGNASAQGVETMLGTPALVDTDADGYVDTVIGATSQGWLFAYDTENSTLETTVVNGAKFYLTPNIDLDSAGDIKVIATSGDNPLYYDVQGSAANKIYYYKYALADGVFQKVGEISLPANHKVFSRPKLINDQLVAGTTTGDTFNFCDADPDDPGSLLLYDLSKIGTPDVLTDSIDKFGPILAPTIVSDGRILVFASRTESAQPTATASVFRNQQAPSFQEDLSFTIGDVFGISNWQDDLLHNLKENLEEKADTAPSTP